MSDLRRLNTIGSRYDVEVSRHPDPWRLLRSRLSWIFVIGTLLACIPWLLGDHRAFQSECVSDAHRVFGQNCQACHDSQLVPLRRMISFNNALHSTSDEKCKKCHGETNSDHLSRASLADPALPLELAEAKKLNDGKRLQSLKQLLSSDFKNLGCAGCHREHRGNLQLSYVADANCTNCHRKAHDTVSPRHFELSFGNFRDHPDFAIWRPKTTDNAPQESQYDPSPHVEWVGEQPTDRTAIKFSHHRHLDPKLPSGTTTTQELRCTDCHQPDQGGAYFRPIRFEQHCHRCHKLGFPTTGELPHVKPEIIRGILLDGLARNANHPPQNPDDGLGGPTKPPLIATNQAEKVMSLVKDQLEGVEARLFNTPPEVRDRPESIGLLEAACTKCHFTEKSTKTDGTWTIKVPQIPEQWMTHTRFRHDRHLSVDCSLCHTRNGYPSESVDRNPFYPVLNDDASKSSSIYASVSARDVLLPRIDVCRRCHGHDASTQASVSDKCIDCHSYHHMPAPKEVPSGIRDLLKAGIPGTSVGRSIGTLPESHR